MQHRSPVPADEDLKLTLLGGFSLTRGDAVLPASYNEARLVGLLALHGRPLQRGYVAGTLWLDSSEDHAAGNLRTALWRLRALDARLIASSRTQLSLAPEVEVDLHLAIEQARRLLHKVPRPLAADDPIMLGGDLLPGWYDDWVLIERERFRQLRLRALEALCDDFSEQGQHGLALDAGLACVATEPLRESAHRAVMRVHLAEGNPTEAIRQYRLYRDLVRREFGLAPSAQMQELIRGFMTGDETVTQTV